MSDVTRVSGCRLCDGELSLIVQFIPTPPGDHYVTADRWNEEQASYPLDLMVCQTCGAVQLADTLDPALIYPDYLYTTSVSKGLPEHFDHYAADVLERLKLPEKSFVIDIGSNDGTLLKAFQRKGHRALGIDPAKAIAQQAINAGVSTFCAFLTKAIAIELRMWHPPADLITANHMMANVADLHDFIEAVKVLLAKDGTFVFETGYWPTILQDNLIDTIEHEHIHYFAVAPLQRFFAHHGLTLVRVETQPTKGGSLRGYVQRNGAMPDVSVGRMIAEEWRSGCTDPDMLTDWIAQLQGIERQLRQRAEVSDDETWVGYGAAVGSTLQLHQFGLGEILECLIDGNPQKQGRLSPGYHLRVVDPSMLAEIQPDCIVILAWRYAAMIQAQHPEFKGKWLIPLPKVVAA